MTKRENQIVYADRIRVAPPVLHQKFEHNTAPSTGGIFSDWHNDFNDWLDENGYATGAIEWAKKNLTVNGRHHYFDTSHHELDRKKVAEGYVQFSQKRGQAPIVEMRYTRGGEVISINSYEMTVADVGDAENPRLIYRPFMEEDGSTKFRLVHEKVNRTYSYAELPVYLNYLMVSAKREVYLTVDNPDCHYHAVIEILDRLKPLSKFNSVPVTPEVVAAYRNYVANLDGTREAAIQATIALIVAARGEEIRFKASLKS